jgi:hypothetical protein
VAGPLGDELVEDRRETPKLVQVRGGQLGEPGLAVGREPDAGETVVVIVAPALNESGGFGAVNQLDAAAQPSGAERDVRGTDGGSTSATTSLCGWAAISPSAW